ncbi:hypothetical protein [Tsukamurella tyrosinosolvens]|uniref:hypothetical protein n=1 Tax=Tsukamurella tyrosinosolvens TaxID=57704 RepID=UPI000DF6F1A1|nr:hypothetical protein [Tsukamurella tyrosinosolvens]RDB49354.1 hypothetical protein DVB87_03225 [Tsukamurella tyrosinosolvens]
MTTSEYTARVRRALEQAPLLNVQVQRTVDGTRTEILAGDVVLDTSYGRDLGDVVDDLEVLAEWPVDWAVFVRVHRLAARLGYRLEFMQDQRGRLTFLLRSRHTGGATPHTSLDGARKVLRQRLTALRREAQQQYATASRAQDGSAVA